MRNLCMSSIPIGSCVASLSSHNTHRPPVAGDRTRQQCFANQHKCSISARSWCRTINVKKWQLSGGGLGFAPAESDNVCGQAATRSQTLTTIIGGELNFIAVCSTRRSHAAQHSLDCASCTSTHQISMSLPLADSGGDG